MFTLLLRSRFVALALCDVTGQFPFKSAEFDQDDDVVRTLESLFGAAVPGTAEGEDVVICRNRQGGCAIHLGTLTAESLRAALDTTKAVPDVAFEPGQATYGSRSGTDFTRMQLPLSYLESLFLVSHGQ